MTNETTASQPKSIGDDVMRIRDEVDWENGFVQLLEGYKHATDHGICSRESVQAQIIAYVRSRAPAAQASATIQSAPTDEQILKIAAEQDYGDEDHKCIIRLARAFYAATIQEPVTVAEPVGAARTSADDERVNFEAWYQMPDKEGLRFPIEYIECKKDDGTYEFKFVQNKWEGWQARAAPMVAEPVVWQFREMRDSAWQGWVPCDKSTYDLFIADPEPNAQVRALGVIGAAPMVADPAGAESVRASFESWCIRNNFSTNKWPDGVYLVSETVGAWEGWQAALAATVKAVPSEALTDAQRERIRDGLSIALGGAMDCTRVWSAWGIGTMSEDDFQLLADNDERLDELVDAVAVNFAAPLADKTEGGE